jgi:eukaryotic-like serine/threonine-protein kinase
VGVTDLVVSDITSNDPLINRTVEGYHFIKRLGEGTYGVVYLARHPRIKDRLVAIKYIKLGDPQQIKKVEREVDILARLQHPNVIDIYDAYRFDHYQLIVMELIRGGSLRDAILQMKGLLDIKSLIEIAEQLAFALGYVHDENILHLDLKPANILLDPVAQGKFARCVITDFGIAQIVNPGAMMSTNLVGTPRYMSPEHFGFGDTKPDRRSDIYSLGIILYELVVGTVPFQAPQLLDLLNQHAYSPVPPPSQTVPYIPAALDSIILKSLAKSQADRFQTASEMGSALRELRLGPLASFKSPADRLSGEALGVIAQASAEVMAAVDTPFPPQVTTIFNIQVMKPDGEQESIGFDKQSIIIGREKGVDLQLDQTKVSRRHAQIECDRNGNLYVTDLQSANGTYLDGVRLTPQERVLWKRNQYLEIQGYLLQIDGLADQQRDAVNPFVFKTDVVVALLDEIDHQRSKPSVHVSLSPAIVYIEPGKPQYIQVRVTPQHTPVARYEPRVRPGPGVDERWYTVPAAQVIQPGDTYTFDFIVSAPVIGTIGGRTHEITLEVVADQPDIPAAYQILKVRVVPLTRFTVALRPNEVSHNRRRQSNVVVTNTGNVSERFAVEVQSPDTLKVVVKTPQVEIAPGQESEVRLRFKPARNVWRTSNRLIYIVTVRAASGNTERANGTYIFRRAQRVPLWILLVWIVLVIAVTRYFAYQVSFAAQFEEVRFVLDYIARSLTGRL